MRIACISYGHVDAILPLIKHLNIHIKTDLYLVFSKDKRKESIINFEEVELQEGLLNALSTKLILPQPLKNYFNNQLDFINLFIYDSLKFLSIRNFILSFKFARHLREYDVIHFNGQDGTMLWLLVFLARKKKVFTIHDYEDHYSGPRLKKINLGEYINRKLVGSRSQVILQNEEIYNRITKKRKAGHNTINYIPFGFLDIYKEYDQQNKDIEIESDLLFFGRISQYKGLEYFLNAISHVDSVFGSLKVMIAGDGDFHFDISSIKKKKNITIINRYIPNEELVSMIKSTKIVICPYINATQSGVVMTAFAFNKPVIASNVGGLSEAVIEGVTGKLVPPKDSHKLGEAIIALLSNNQLLKHIEKNIITLGSSSRFSWPIIASKTIQVYFKKNR